MKRSLKINSEELERLRRVVIDLNVQWQMFEELFLDSTNYAVFNRTGALFWDHFRAYLLDALFASISRFFDPVGNKHQMNLSLAAVLEFPEIVTIKVDLERRLTAMIPVWEKGVKIWRHKKLSHSDLSTALGKSSLPEVPFSEVKKLVDDISGFVREIDHQLNQTDVSYRINPTKWTPEVLRYLKAGIQKIDADYENRIRT